VRPRSSSSLSSNFSKALICHPSLQTVNNELKTIQKTVDNLGHVENDRIAFLLKSVYNDDLKDAESLLKESLTKVNNRSNLTNDLYLNAFDTNRPCSGLKSKTARSVLIPTSRSLNNYTYKSQTKKEKLTRPLKPQQECLISSRSDSSNGFIGRLTIGEDGILNSLLQEFPYLYTAPETIHYLWQKHSKQIETFAKLGKEIEQTCLSGRLERPVSNLNSLKKDG